MPAQVVCISRTLAAGGEEVGRGVAERLGFRVAYSKVTVIKKLESHVS